MYSAFGCAGVLTLTLQPPNEFWSPRSHKRMIKLVTKCADVLDTAILQVRHPFVTPGLESSLSLTHLRSSRRPSTEPPRDVRRGLYRRGLFSRLRLAAPQRAARAPAAAARGPLTSPSKIAAGSRRRLLTTLSTKQVRGRTSWTSDLPRVRSNRTLIPPRPPSCTSQ